MSDRIIVHTNCFGGDSTKVIKVIKNDPVFGPFTWDIDLFQMDGELVSECITINCMNEAAAWNVWSAIQEATA